jgi:hypothetical protein
VVAAAPAAAAAPRTEQVGPLQVSGDGRDTVRGGRPDGASIHETYVPPAVDPDDAEARAELAHFERRTPSARIRPTIVASPPEAWMAALALPDLPVRWNHQLVAYFKYFRDDPAARP